MTLGMPALVVLIVGSVCSGALLALLALAVWLIRNNPMR